MLFSSLSIQLREIVGEEIFWKLTQEFGGTTIYIPVSIDVRSVKRTEERNKEVMKMKEHLREKYPEYSDTTIYKIVAKEFELTYPRIYQICVGGY